MTAPLLYDWQFEPTAYELDRLDAALGENFTAEPIGDGWAIDCSGCQTHVVDDIDEALALIDHHRKLHDRENQEV